MRTRSSAGGRGVASLILGRILGEARERSYSVVRLESGSQDFFAPARALYRTRGFVEGPPFAEYVLDPNSVYMSIALRTP